MKRIRALAEVPAGLATYRRLEGEAASWRRFKSHEAGEAYEELRNALVDIQHGLCGYCEIAIASAPVQVEHVVPQRVPGPEHRKDLDPTNMMACCLGGTKETAGDEDRYLPPVKQNMSCGQAKGGQAEPNFLDPRSLPALPPLVRVRFSGEVEPDSDACTANGVPVEHVRNTIQLLGLNVRRLQQARRKRWSDLSVMFGSLEDPGLIVAAARQELLLDQRGCLPVFFTTARSFFGPAAEHVLSEPPHAWI